MTKETGGYCPKCDTVWAEPGQCRCVGINGEVRSRNEREHNRTWNAAIDKCIEVANKYDSYGPVYEMRMLKK